MEEKLGIPTIETPEPKGKVTIELYNANGEKEGQYEQDNYVSPVAFIEAEKLTAYIGRASYQSSSPTPAKSIREKVDSIILMNTDRPIDKVNDRFITGDVIGIGREGVTNSTTLTGSFNSIESSVSSPAYKKLVIDFPTSAGNGTFTDIYGFQYGAYYGRPAIYQTASPNVPFSIGGTGRSRSNFLHEARGNYYTFYEDYGNGKTTIDIFKYPSLEFRQTATDGNKDTASYVLGNATADNHTQYSVTLPFAIVVSDLTYTIDDSYVYVYVISRRELYRIPIDTSGELVKVRTFTSAEFSRTSQTDYLIAYNPADNLLYFVEYIAYPNIGQSPGKIIKVSKTDYTILSSDPMKPFEITTTSAWERSVYGRFHPTHKNILLTPYNMFDVTEKRVIGTSFEGNSTYNMTYGIIGKWLTARGMIALNQSFFSRVKLDSPVTKTSAQTMKIIYEWAMPPLNLANY